VEHVLRSSGLLHLEASRTRAKLAEERRRVLRVASSQRLRGDKTEDGRVDTIGCIGLMRRTTSDSCTLTLPF
jgi:hypothetical protein